MPPPIGSQTSTVLSHKVKRLYCEQNIANKSVLPSAKVQEAPKEQVWIWYQPKLMWKENEVGKKTYKQMHYIRKIALQTLVY